MDLVARRVPAPLPLAETRGLRHLLRSHGLSGIAACAVADSTLAVPADVATGIERDWANSRGWADVLDGETGWIGDAAAAAASATGLAPPILLKGRAVARRYEDPSLRPYSDIDLMVPVEELEHWARLLGGLGFRGPSSEVGAARRREQAGVSLVRRSGDAVISCDLHACLSIERRARDFAYEQLLVRTEPSPFPGLVEPTVDAELVVLALHLAHHYRAHWKLVWLRDFLELASPASVEAARDLAGQHDVGWALEAALFAVEELVGYPAFGARPATGEPIVGLAPVRLDRDVLGHHLSLVYRLGPLAAIRYFGSRIDPRRFCDPEGSVDLEAAWAWWRRSARRASTTAWRWVVSRSSLATSELDSWAPKQIRSTPPEFKEQASLTSRHERREVS